ncbi:hypothetical protein H4R34_005563 [Dimargaris verticillata]|uniref:RlpA-like protein double-psi beta-barrel domain-containing protein n=1 Tax=Dimargaris verticillata TaxID=2761393 RepID=A0A9W8AWA5_9FUNG|nr:hypothetical protein H4R34_005563 [Dimargaris verticillata]
MHKAIVTVSLLAVVALWCPASAAPVGTHMQVVSPQSLVARSVSVVGDSLVRRSLTKRSPGGSGKPSSEENEKEEDEEEEDEEKESKSSKKEKKEGKEEKEEKSSSSEGAEDADSLSGKGKGKGSLSADESTGGSVGESKGGRTTYHNFSGESNACGGSYEDGDMVVALPTADIGDLCDKEITVTRGDKSVSVKVVDECASCSSGDLDLSPVAFEALGAGLSKGEMFDVSWQGGSSK